MPIRNSQAGFKIDTNDELALRAIFKTRIKDAKKRAKRGNYQCNLTVDALIILYKQQEGRCYLSDQRLSLDMYNYYTLSLDRIDSRKGYTIGNVGLACWIANQVKNCMQLDDFFMWCGYIASVGKA